MRAYLVVYLFYLFVCLFYCPIRFSLFGFLSNTLITLLIMVLLFFFVLLSVISHDAVEQCGTFCPHSPVHVLYSTFEPYLQFTKVNPPL